MVELVDPFEEEFDSTLCDEIFYLMEKTLWLIDYSYNQVDREDTGLSMLPGDLRRHFDFEEEALKEMEGLIKEGKYIVSYYKGNFKIITKISELQEIISLLVVEVAENNNFSDKDLNTIRNISFDARYANVIAKFCIQDNEIKITEEELLKNDVVIFRQNGGLGIPFLRNFFKLKLNKSCYPANSPILYAKNMFDFFTSVDSAYFDNNPNFFIYNGEKGDHFFTVSTNKCRRLKEEKRNFKDFSKQTIFQPLKNFQNQLIPVYVVKRIWDLAKRHCPLTLKDVLEKSKSLTYETFAEFIMSSNPAKKASLAFIIDREYWRIHLRITDLEQVLGNLGIFLAEEDLNFIFKIIRKKSSSKGLLPYQVALVIRRLLIKKHNKIVDAQDLEHQLCILNSLPMPFYGGDLNYSDVDKENPGHEELIIRYHFGYKKIIYFNRQKKREKREPDDYNMELKIYYLNDK